MIIEKIKADFAEAAQTLERFMNEPQTWILLEKAGEIMFEALRNGKKILACGNGGSMCDAMHFCEELTGNFRHPRQALPAIAIADSAHLTCTANDFGFDHIFSRYVDALGNEGDVLLAISTSGNSANILKAVESAQNKGMKIVALTGKTGGKLASLADAEIRSPQTPYSDRTQEIHIKVIHSLIHYIELAFETQNI